MVSPDCAEGWQTSALCRHPRFTHQALDLLQRDQSSNVVIRRQTILRAAGLASALNVMRAAVDGEGRLTSMPNNTVIMVSFAACFALGLSMTRHGNQVAVSPNARRLIEQTSQVLKRIGSSPKHRNGTPALFGAHIKRIMDTSVPDPGFTASGASTQPQTPFAVPRTSTGSPDMNVPVSEQFRFRHGQTTRSLKRSIMLARPKSYSSWMRTCS